MKLDIKALALTVAIMWCVYVLGAAVVNAISGAYAPQFLDMLASWYPGYHATHSVAQVAIVTVYAFVDVLIGGAVFGWLYNGLQKGSGATE